jgi:hypothetical protein
MNLAVIKLSLDVSDRLSPSIQGLLETMHRYQAGQPRVYDPNLLLDALIAKLNLKDDGELSDALEVLPPVISKIRHRRIPVGASLLIRMHEVSEMSTRTLRELMGDRREKYRGESAL